MPVRRLQNKAQCLKCKDIIESKHTHDFRYCKCGAIFVDGGHDYWRYGGELEYFKRMDSVDSPQVEESMPELTKKQLSLLTALQSEAELLRTKANGPRKIHDVNSLIGIINNYRTRSEMHPEEYQFNVDKIRESIQKIRIVVNQPS